MRQLTSTVLLTVQLFFWLAQSASASELVRHTVESDGHPLAVWEKSAVGATDAILLVHGRTWSALPDFDLQVDGEELSLMDGLVDEGFAVFAVDLRGYGQTPRDSSGWLTPNRAADDVANVTRWIASHRKTSAEDTHQRGNAGTPGSAVAGRRPHLFGWSMGSTISQLAVQRNPGIVSSLTLFGYWRDVDLVAPPDAADIRPLRERNTAVAAASDFITPGSIKPASVEAYVSAALAADPVRVDIRGLDEYNALDPARIEVPTLVIFGEFDPLAPAGNQAALFLRLGTGHKQLVSVPDGDHAAFLESPREYFIQELTAFLKGSGS